MVAEFLTSWIRPFKPEHNIWYMGLWKKCGLSGIMLEKYVKETGMPASLVRLIVVQQVLLEVKVGRGSNGVLPLLIRKQRIPFELRPESN